MPIHAVLGATGGTGSAVLRGLLSSKIPDLHINVLVRTKSKLLQAIPQLESSTLVNIIEAPISNEDALNACVNGASVIYVCIGTNHASRKNTIAVTTATRLIATLERFRKVQGTEYKAPVILFNRSMGLNSNVQFMPAELIRRFVAWLMFGIFEDLLRASEMYNKAAKAGLLTFITADPPALMGPNGTEATGYELVQKGKAAPMLNYADFGKAMIELGQRPEEFGGKVVAVSATGAVQPTDVLENLYRFILGFKTRLIPF